MPMCPAAASAAQSIQFWAPRPATPGSSELRQIGGFARYRPEVVTTLRDRLPELVRGLLPARGRPYDGEASDQRVVEHEEPAEPGRRISKIIISGCTPGAA